MNDVENATMSPEAKSLKDDIHTLETRLQTFRNREDWWNEGYLRLGLTTIVLATILGGLSLFCQRKASNIELSSRPFAEELGRKNARLREVLDQSAQIEVAKAQKDAFDASERAGRAEQGAGEANERALKAQSSLAEAEQHSAEANAKAEGFRLDIAKANEVSAQAQAQVAGATAEAAKANLELAKLKTPRTLGVEQQKRISSRIEQFPDTPFDLWVSTDSDSTALMGLIDEAIRGGKWKFKPAGIIQFAGKAGIIADSGVSIRFAEEHRDVFEKPALALANALADEGIQVKAVSRYDLEAEKDKDRMAIHVMIGSKPLN